MTASPREHLLAEGLTKAEFCAAYPGLFLGAFYHDGTKEGREQHELLSILLECVERDAAARPSLEQFAAKLSGFLESLGPAAAAAAQQANAADLAAAQAARQSAPQEVMADGTPYGDLMRQLVCMECEQVLARVQSLNMDERKVQCMLEHMYSLRTPQQRAQWDQGLCEWQRKLQELRQREQLLQMWAAEQLRLQQEEQRRRQQQQQLAAPLLWAQQWAAGQPQLQQQQQQQCQAFGLLANQWWIR